MTDKISGDGRDVSHRRAGSGPVRIIAWTLSSAVLLVAAAVIFAHAVLNQGPDLASVSPRPFNRSQWRNSAGRAEVRYAMLGSVSRMLTPKLTMREAVRTFGEPELLARKQSEVDEEDKRFMGANTVLLSYSLAAETRGGSPWETNLELVFGADQKLRRWRTQQE